MGKVGELLWQTTSEFVPRKISGLKVGEVG
jgi:hypothetical protein